MLICLMRRQIFKSTAREHTNIEEQYGTSCWFAVPLSNVLLPEAQNPVTYARLHICGPAITDWHIACLVLARH